LKTVQVEMVPFSVHRHICLAFVVMLMCAWIRPSFALTPAGTPISNQARLQFQVQNAPGEIQSNTVAFRVAQLLDVAVTSQDASDVGVNSPDVGRVLTFRVSNIGNGTETYRLSRADALPGDQFDPVPSSVLVANLYLENGLQPGFQASGPYADIPYAVGSNDPVMPAATERTVYVVSTIPTGQAHLDGGRSQLVATSAQADVPGKLPGTGLPALNTVSQERVVGLSSGQAHATGTYRVTGLQTTMLKTVAKVVDPQGGSTLMPGAVITYRLVTDIRGNGTASSVMVSDALPAQVRYKSGTLHLNGVVQTDAADSDASQVDVAAVPQTLRVKLGSQNAPFLATVEFDVIVE
jgi:uncharacterized repeat protein (TIGR01451 family)